MSGRPQAERATRATASCTSARAKLSSMMMSAPAAIACVELGQRGDLDLDARGVRGARPGALDRHRDAAGGDDVVVLDQHRAAEAVAVVVRAADADGVALEAREGRAWSCACR